MNSKDLLFLLPLILSQSVFGTELYTCWNGSNIKSPAECPENLSEKNSAKCVSRLPEIINQKK